MHRVDEELAVLPAEVDLAAAEMDLATRSDRLTVLRHKLGSAIDAFDYVLIDCPPSLGLLTLNALSLAESVVVPMQAHFLALQGLSKLLETVQLVRQQVNAELTVAGVVLCMHEAQTNLAREVVSDLEAFFESARGQGGPWSEAKVYHPPIRRNVKLAECPSFGQTIFQYEPWCAGARDYMALAEAFDAEPRDGAAPPSRASDAGEPHGETAESTVTPPKLSGSTGLNR
jgi:chromosome partitioning protein